MSTRYQDVMRRLGGLKGLMRRLGHGPTSERWNSFGCPFCQKKAGGVFVPKGGMDELFKCHHSDCITGNQALNPVGYIALFFGLSESSPEKGTPSPAYQKLLEMAGVWEAPAASRSLRPKSGPDPAGPAPASTSPEPTDPGPNSAPTLSASDAGRAEVVAATPSGGPIFQVEEGPPPKSGHPEEPLFGEDPSEHEDDDGLELPAKDARAALRWFWENSQLTPEDQEELWIRRGILPEIALSFGLRSNRRENLDLLQEAKTKFGAAACEEAGLWVNRSNEGEWAGPEEQTVTGTGKASVPNEFYYGKGVIGEERGVDGEKRRIYGWNHPILIPYFDARLDKRKSRSSAAVVTEGEFKAIALHQVLAGGAPFEPDPQTLVAIRPHKHWATGVQPWCYLGPGGGAFAVAALPGITFCKRDGETWKVRYLLDSWLAALDARDAVVVYDNEEKRNANGSRFDSVIYAVWLARDLCHQGIRGRWAQIPMEMRDEHGKADWDNVLARAVAGRRPSDWPDLRPDIARTWRSWLTASVDMRQDIPIQVRFDDRVIISSLKGKRHVELPAPAEAKLRRISYRTRMPRPGGESGPGRLNTRRIGRRLMGIAREAEAGQRLAITGKEASDHLRMLGAAYLILEGGYFFHHSVKPMPAVRRAPKPHEREFWLAVMDEAESVGDVDSAWAAEMALRGRPERFTDFFVEPLYKLLKASGEFVRVVNIVNRYGERTSRLELPGTLYSTPTRLREFLNTRSDGGSWGSGERELQAKMEDWNSELAFRTVKEVCAWGWHAEAKAWFAGDCAIDAEGIHRLNRHEYFHLKSGKWQVGKVDREGTDWFQVAPEWHPEVSGDPERIAWLLSEFVEQLHLAIGDSHAFLALGIVFAYAAAPEIFEAYHCFPGLWIHGEASQGKTTIARWLMRLCGFPFVGRHGGVSLESSSGAGGALVMQQYSNLPVWFEEAQTDTRGELLRLLKDTFNRIGGAKRLSTGMRQILTAPIVIGQATSNDHATRTRYPHILVAASRRLPKGRTLWDTAELSDDEAKKLQERNYQYVEENLLGDLYLVFRHVLLNRATFVKQVLSIIRDWVNSESMQSVEKRTATVRGIALAGFAAALEVCGVSKLRHWIELDGRFQRVAVDREELLEYGLRPFLVEEARRSIADIRETGEIEEFLRALLTCWERQGFGDQKSDWRAYFSVQLGDYADPPGVPENSIQLGNWQQVSLFLNPDSLVDALTEYLRRQNKILRLRRDDLKAQMSARPWWIKKDTHYKVRFQVNGVSVGRRPWGLNLDLLPDFGYRPISDAELLAAHPNDPRKGPLYAIVDALTKETQNP